jgi:putative methyltransferase (TIGR04325 family)
MCYGYIISLSARKKQEISILDLGGGLGHYYLISKALLPNVGIQYSVCDKPLLCQAGKELLPEVEFYENIDDALAKKYDLVFASNSIQYFKNWQEIVSKLSKSTRNYLYITQIPIVHKVNSFVAVQRAYQEKNYGYNAEFCGWILNYQDFIKCVAQSEMCLEREFLLGAGPSIMGAPEQNEFLGFLFTPNFENDQTD